MDVFSRSERSRIMSRIRSRGNVATELRMIEFFRANKIIGWRRNKKLKGNPDFIFPTNRLVVFVDGCFWHGCAKHSRPPRSNQNYWLPKMLRNKQRDRLVTRALHSQGWRVLRIWEHELSRKNEARLLRRIQKAMK